MPFSTKDESAVCPWREGSSRDSIYIYIYIDIKTPSAMTKRPKGVGGEIPSHHPSQDLGEMVL